MTQKDAKAMIAQRSLILKGWRKYTHLEFPLYIFIIGLVITTFFFLGKLGIVGHGNMQPSTFFQIAAGIFGIACLAYLVQYKSLKFKVVKSPGSTEKILNAINLTSSDREWQKASQGNNYYVGKARAWSFGFNWGEEITIVWDDENVYITSICDPDKKAAVTSMGANKANIEKFIEHLKNENTTY